LLRTKMRSGLTTLGVVIGVAAVIIMQAMGTGTTHLITGELSSLGTNMLMMVPGAVQGGNMGRPAYGAPLFDLADVEAIRSEASAVRFATGVNFRSVKAIVGERNRSTSLYGIEPDYFEIRQWYAASGRVLAADDEKYATKGCVLGETVRLDLYGSTDPVGSQLRIHDMTCEVVGVMEAKGASAFGQDQDDMIFVPLRTYNRRISGNDDVAIVMMSAASEDQLDLAKTQVEALMRQRRRILPGEDDDFTVRDMRELVAIMGTVTGVLTSLLAGVAAVSLVVGGIGIMNIMLVSVTERTREIGIRLAVGARSRDILWQFLVEAVVLSSLGGLLGLVLGGLGAWTASRALGIPFVMPLQASVIAMAFSVLVGVVFGVVPARKASRLRPIEALRFE
jgi:putative ABC transport system permease protein